MHDTISLFDLILFSVAKKKLQSSWWNFLVYNTHIFISMIFFTFVSSTIKINKRSCFIIATKLAWKIKLFKWLCFVKNHSTFIILSYIYDYNMYSFDFSFCLVHIKVSKSILKLTTRNGLKWGLCYHGKNMWTVHWGCDNEGLDQSKTIWREHNWK